MVVQPLPDGCFWRPTRRLFRFLTGLPGDDVPAVGVVDVDFLDPLPRTSPGDGPVVDEDPLAPSKQNAAITVSSVSRRAGVTRKSIYRNDDLVARIRATAPWRPSPKASRAIHYLGLAMN